MPIYEFRCLSCKRKTSVFIRNIAADPSGTCEWCGSTKLARLLSKFAVHGGKLDLENMDGIDESDPRTMARLMRQMGEEAGEPMEPGFEDMIARMEAGESPDSAMAAAAQDDDAADGDDF